MSSREDMIKAERATVERANVEEARERAIEKAKAAAEVSVLSSFQESFKFTNLLPARLVSCPRLKATPTPTSTPKKWTFVLQLVRPRIALQLVRPHSSTSWFVLAGPVPDSVLHGLYRVDCQAVPGSDLHVFYRVDCQAVPDSYLRGLYRVDCQAMRGT
ncbi:hypothetical protein GUJ93_ZPchr0007g5841 [Zizania palustris]|uniref:Uncharacterized protein n=1 Tax=Zizania palustris TaxID=103762 RepID=A0A8J5VQ43_ZIZPA|nr:hypothetical protein GUJ93_ZPchr0007g5841 [Zizania palustris]